MKERLQLRFRSSPPPGVPTEDQSAGQLAQEGTHAGPATGPSTAPGKNSANGENRSR